MRATEFIVEYRDRMYQYIKSLVPTWPDYVVKDWLYANFARGDVQTSNYSFDTVGEDIPKIIKAQHIALDAKWQLVPNMKFTMDMWIPEVVAKLTARAGGKPHPNFEIPRDAERHNTQAQLAQKQGGVRKEPVILVKRPDGYDLIEGWHRTIQHFNMYPDGYVGPAYVAVEDSQLEEVFAPGKTNWDWHRRTSEEAIAVFHVGDREYMWQAFVHGGRYGSSNKTKWEIQFRLIRDYDKDPGDLDLFGKTGTGNSAEVLSTAVDITRAFLEYYGLDKVEEITFNAKEDSRIGLYAKMIKRLLPNWDLYSKKDPHNGMEYHLTDRRAYDKPENKIDEDLVI
jgi:hypothetical protein